MHRNTVFWGSLLILLGVVFLLDNLGVLPVRAWQIIWPVFLVALGLWILFGSLLGQRAVYTKSAIVPLEVATQASVQVNHGAGRLRISAGAGTNNLIEGNFNGGLDLSTRREGDLLKTRMSVPSPGGYIHIYGL